MGYYLPQTMKRARRWVLWKLEDGKKKPYSANYNGLASSTRANTWASYEKALTKFEYTGEYSGLGYVFTAEDGLVFIDLDHCINEDGEINDFAQTVINLFPKTYAEYSQSETGLHIIVRGTIPKSYKSDKIELYANGRYMAFTGNAYEAAEPAEAQDALNKLIALLPIKEDQEQKPRPTEPFLTTDDETIIKRASSGANGANFTALYNGDITRYKSQSEADLRLISILYYYSGDVDQVERLFLDSALGQRQKGQRSDYIRRTIQKATENTTPQKKPSKRQINGLQREGLTDIKSEKKIRR